jgi:non-heme chloroperoxidase
LDLKKFDVPTRVAHCGDDPIVPIGITAHSMSRIVISATQIVCPGGSHGCTVKHEDRLIVDPLALPGGGRVPTSGERTEP